MTTIETVRERLEEFANSQTVVGQWLNDRKHMPTANDIDNVFQTKLQEAMASEMLHVISKFHQDFKDRTSLKVLDIGCSMGSFAFAMRPYAKHIVGIDIEKEAIECAQAYTDYKQYTEIDFFLENGVMLETTRSKYNHYFDLIVLKDVVEHIASLENLDMMLSNIKELLAPNGVVFIEAPNYIFPYEVHLNIPMIPLTPKFLLHFTALLFGKIKDKETKIFINHINIVSPGRLESSFQKTNLSFINLYEEWKLKKIFLDEYLLCDSYKFMQPLINFIKNIGLGKLVYFAFKSTKMYPTLWYLARSKE